MLQTKGVAGQQLLQVVAQLAHAVAATGLVGGQVLTYEFIYFLKSKIF
ncbi:hypothetical protein H6G97_27935 [Nostoc flagelliforme FACHB-838]|uniref:Uncharacterized protein n=1 Tax=Nostoc flagelliforme FACHB-838 TaxID=2692904 RepID=A0ABR8DVH2_9NOSO|nr:hypothetical protein [Nostoc flagelliforme]MBD2533194.1 hypothetical protein [Nostoc flagelliforme FACHB-838]